MSNSSDHSASLNASIAKLEQKKDAQLQSLKGQLRATGESLKPGNIIKGAVRDLTQSGPLKSFLIKAAIGLAAGFVAKKVFNKISHDNVSRRKRNIWGNALQYGISYLAANKNQLLKSAGIYVAHSLITGIQNRRHRKHHSNGVEHHTA